MPTTGRYPLVQINSVYLTKDGLVTGIPCKIKVDGLSELALTDDFQITKALSGRPYMQVSELQLGKPLSLEFEQMAESVYDSIVAILQAYITSSTAITLSISNTPYGSFSSMSVIPDVGPVRHDHEFSNTQLKNGSFHFLTI